MSEHRLRQELNHRRYIEAQLLEQYPELAEDPDALKDTLDGMNDLEDIIAWVLDKSAEDDMLKVGLKTRIADMQERKARLENRIEKARQIVCDVMEKANIQKITRPEMTISTRTTPDKLLIVDEGEIPTSFYTPQPDKLDKAEVKTALKSGQDVPGAMLSNGGKTISIRTK